MSSLVYSQYAVRVCILKVSIHRLTIYRITFRELKITGSIVRADCLRCPYELFLERARVQLIVCYSNFIVFYYLIHLHRIFQTRFCSAFCVYVNIKTILYLNCSKDDSINFIQRSLRQKRFGSKCTKKVADQLIQVQVKRQTAEHLQALKVQLMQERVGKSQR